MIFYGTRVLSVAYHMVSCFGGHQKFFMCCPPTSSVTSLTTICTNNLRCHEIATMKLLPHLASVSYWKCVYLIKFGYLGVGERTDTFCWQKDEENWECLWPQGFFKADVRGQGSPATLAVGGKCYRVLFFKWKKKKIGRATQGNLFHIFDQRRPYLDTTLKKDLPTYEFLRSKWVDDSCKLKNTKWILNALKFRNIKICFILRLLSIKMLYKGSLRMVCQNSIINSEFG